MTAEQVNLGGILVRNHVPASQTCCPVHGWGTCTIGYCKDGRR